MRAYLCVPGGFQSPEILGSRTGLTPLRSGDQLSCATSQSAPRSLSGECPFLSFPNEWRLRATRGPQADWFEANAFFEQTFVVSRASNRMGLRLEGIPLRLEREMVSEPVCPGCVQITREGLPIILGVDGQTIGGYPKIAVVCDADLDAVGQMRPGDRVRFAPASLDQALAATHQRELTLNEWLTRIRISVDAPAVKS
jgi:allophanate hydrolase subunit 2